MALLDPKMFETITPSQYISFTLPNPFPIRVSVLDSPNSSSGCTSNSATCPVSVPRVGAMVVPRGREDDWVFTTLSGHLQLLLSASGIHRLVLLFPHSATSSNKRANKAELEEMLMPLVISLSPKMAFNYNYSFRDFRREIPFLSYDDGVISSVVVEICAGSLVGEMLVEDVEIRDEFDCEKVESRRRLRFKRTPNLIQTQIPIFPNPKPCKNESLSYILNTAVLVQPYLVPMVASISLVAKYLEEKFLSNFRPKALCLGVGGGALVSFLNTRLGFEVVGVEEDEAVLALAKRHFGLQDDKYIHVCIGDGIEYMKKLVSAKHGCDMGNCEFDVVMVDLDSSEVGTGSMAPPMEFLEEPVLFSMRAVLSENGIVVVNVIPMNKLSYKKLVDEFRKVFDEVYEIDVENEENFVLIGSRNPIKVYSRDCEGGFLRKLRETISGKFMQALKKM